MRDDVFNHKMFASVNRRSESRLACRYGGFRQVERRLQAATVQSVVSARAFGSSLTSNTFFCFDKCLFARSDRTGRRTSFIVLAQI